MEERRSRTVVRAAPRPRQPPPDPCRRSTPAGDTRRSRQPGCWLPQLAAGPATAPRASIRQLSPSTLISGGSHHVQAYFIALGRARVQPTFRMGNEAALRTGSPSRRRPDHASGVPARAGRDRTLPVACGRTPPEEPLSCGPDGLSDRRRRTDADQRFQAFTTRRTAGRPGTV
jgi:hypothetical protein